MSVTPLPTRQPKTAAEALGRVDPTRREFAVVYAYGQRDVAKACRDLGIGRTTYYEWCDDPNVRVYCDLVVRELHGDARRKMAAHVGEALQVIVDTLTDPDPGLRLKAAGMLLDRTGLSKEAALPRNGGAGADTTLHVNINTPTNPFAQEEQEKRRLKREARAREAQFSVTDTGGDPVAGG